MSIRIINSDVVDGLRQLEDDSVDSVVTDPPYEFGFMGCAWDRTGIANNIAMWSDVLRVLKPGGHLLAFGGTRTYHRMVCAIEDAGFEIRDQIGWVYGSGFPKSLDVSKAIDRTAGAERKVLAHCSSDGVIRKPRETQPGGGNRKENYTPTITAPATDAAKQWEGWGTVLKPAWEPIVLARKPLIGTVVENVLRYGTGALNIAGCRVEISETDSVAMERCNTPGSGRHLLVKQTGVYGRYDGAAGNLNTKQGRWPANLVHDGSPEVLAVFPADQPSCNSPAKGPAKNEFFKGNDHQGAIYPGERGSAARFFYCAKASRSERGEGNNHPTVKPIALMRYLCRLITPPKGLVLDPFLGSGSTAIAASLERFSIIGIERDQSYVELAQRRIQRQIPYYKAKVIVTKLPARVQRTRLRP